MPTQMKISTNLYKEQYLFLNVIQRIVMKGSRLETIEAARKEYAELLKKGWKKTSIFRSYF